MAFVCHSRGKSFTSAEKIRAHKAVHDETKLQCHICDKIFEGRKKFNNHIQSQQAFECEIRLNLLRYGQNIIVSHCISRVLAGG